MSMKYKIFFILLFTILFFNLFNSVYATEIFSDGFESGDYSAWTGTVEDTGTTLEVSSTYAHHGTYSSKAITDGSTHKAYCYKEISDYATIYVRFYIYLDAFSGNYHMYFLKVENTLSGHIVTLGVSGTSRYLKTWRYDATQGWVETESTTTLDLDTWTSLELRFTKGSGNGVIQVWKDGTEVTDLSVTDVDRNIYPNKISLGWTYYCYDTGTNYIDCVKVADTYIGTEPSGQEYIVDLSQSVNVDYSKVLKTDFTLSFDFQPSFSFVKDVVHTVAGGVQYIVDLSLSVTTTFTTKIITGTQYFVDVVFSPTFSFIKEVTTGVIEVVYATEEWVLALLIIAGLFGGAFFYVSKR